MALAVTDSGERSFSLGTKELENFVQVGSNAAEYIKIVPGFGVTNGTSNKANYTGQTVGINGNGDSGSQSPLNNSSSYNGLPINSLDIVADGAHVSDPGCNCDTPVNPNSDFLQEFKVLTSNFSAEDQKGPIVITSVTKAGGSAFHGSAFFTARNHVLNSNDWLNNNSNVQQPANSYYYPGGTSADRSSFQERGSTRTTTSSSSLPALSTTSRHWTPGCSGRRCRLPVSLPVTSRLKR